MLCLCSFPGVLWCLVLYLSFSHFEFILVQLWGCVLVSLICMQLSRFPSNTCWKDCLFLILCSCLLCRRLIDHRYLGLFLGSLFCSIGLYVCSDTSTTLSWWLWLCNIDWQFSELTTVPLNLLMGWGPRPSILERLELRMWRVMAPTFCLAIWLYYGSSLKKASRSFRPTIFQSPVPVPSYPGSALIRAGTVGTTPFSRLLPCLKPDPHTLQEVGEFWTHMPSEDALAAPLWKHSLPGPSST